MALIRQTDRRTGVVYVYEAEARWDPKRRQSRYGRRRLVGHVDPKTGEVVPNRPTRAPASSPESHRELLGACALLDAVADESGVAAALRRALPRSWRRALTVAYYMVCEGSAPLSRLPRFCATHATPDGAPIAPRRPSELFASIGERERDAFCSALAERHGRGDRLFYGTTSMSSYFEALARARWGRDEEDAPPPQADLAMLVGGEGGVPLCYRRVAGTMADVPAVRALIRDMGPSLAGEVRLVMDRGFWSAANVNAMMRGHLKFLMGVPTSLRLYADAVDGHGAELRTRRNLDPSTGLYGMRLAHGWDHGEARPRGGDVAGARRRGYIYLFFDAPRAAEAERRLAGLLRELASELAAGNRIESHERYYDRYFEVRGGRPVGRDAAIAAATARAGYFALFSNEAMGPFEALAIYRDRDAIERRLGDARSLLGFRTPPAPAEDTLAVRLFVTFVALVLAAWLRRRMRETGLDGDYTLEGLLDEVETIERHAREGHRPRVLGVTPRQRAVFERLGYDPPATS